MSLGIIVMVITAGCAMFALLRGALRLVLSTTLLAAALLVAYWVWMETPGLGDRLFKQPPNWFPFVLPAIAGIAVFMLLRKVVRLILKPFGTVGGTPSSFFGKIFSLTFSLVPTALLCITGATAIRHVGTLEQIQHPQSTGTSSLLKKTIDQYIPPAWLQRDFRDTGLRVRSGPWGKFAREVKGLKPDAEGELNLTHSVWRRDVLSAAAVTLGPPGIPGKGYPYAMYGVAVKALE